LKSHTATPRAPAPRRWRAWRRSSFTPAPCAQTNTAIQLAQAAAFAGVFPACRPAVHECVEERLLLLVSQPPRLRPLRRRRTNFRRATFRARSGHAVGEKVARLLRADEQELRHAVLLAVAFRGNSTPVPIFHVPPAGPPRARTHDALAAARGFWSTGCGGNPRPVTCTLPLAVRVLDRHLAR